MSLSGILGHGAASMVSQWGSTITSHIGLYGPIAREVGSSLPSRVKPLTYKIDTCQTLAKHLTLLGSGTDWLVQCQDNVTEWDIRSLYW